VPCRNTTGDNSEADAEYFSLDILDIAYCRLPKDIFNDDELNQCVDECYFESSSIERCKKLREIDFSRYKGVMIWNDLSPESLVFFYMACRFVNGCDIYENNVSEVNLCPSIGIEEPDRDLSHIYDGIRIIDPETKRRFAMQYDRLSGQSVSAKIANGYGMTIVSEKVIRDRILSKCTSEFQPAIRIALNCQSENKSDRQSIISYNYYENRIKEYVLEGLLDVEQLSIPKHDDVSKAIFCNGVDISHGNCYSVKLKN